MRAALPSVLALLWLGLMLALPFAAAGVALELAAIVLLAAGASLAGPALRGAFAGALAAALVLVAGIAVVDQAVRTTFGRPLDLAGDLPLAANLGDFSLDMVPEWQLAAAAAALLLGAPLLFWLNRRALRALMTAGRRRLAVAFAAVAAAAVAWPAPGPACFGLEPVACPAADLIARQAEGAVAAWRPMPEFDRALAADAGTARPGVLAGLNGADVLLVFIESYGTTALRDPRYAATVRPLLAELEKRLGAAGIATASGVLESPTVGGLSWLAHATLLSGVRIPDQRRYDRLVRSERRTLVRDFADAGYRTAGVFPQTLRPWPEGAFFRYDRIRWSGNIAYAGPPFGWTTMPDQYTLWFAEHRVRRAVSGPHFIEIALISSHAPWEPVPPVLPWDALDGGAAFAAPDWSGPRDWPAGAPASYARAIGYTLTVLGEFAERNVGPRTLLIAVGDHQPAPLITGDDAARTVPMHVFSGDPGLVAAFRDWSFAPGLVPSEAPQAPGMEAFRAWFLDRFSPPRTTRASE